MQQVRISIPSMWADHHVLAVREALGKVNGVHAMVASSLYRDVLVEYDPAAVSGDQLATALAQQGYGTDKELAVPAYPKRIDDASDWFQFQERVTVTDRRDLEMSGDFRKY